MYSNPIDPFKVNETILDSDFTFLGKRNILLDNLLGYPSFSQSATEHVLTEDLLKLAEIEKSTCFVKKNGYSHHVTRLMCADKSILFVISKVFVHTDEAGSTKLVTYNWPFAFSSFTKQQIDDNIRFLCTSDFWIALFPSFVRPGSRDTTTPPIIPGEYHMSSPSTSSSSPVGPSTSSLIPQALLDIDLIKPKVEPIE
eukprot:sb/3470738/